MKLGSVCQRVTSSASPTIVPAQVGTTRLLPAVSRTLLHNCSVGNTEGHGNTETTCPTKVKTTLLKTSQLLLVNKTDRQEGTYDF